MAGDWIKMRVDIGDDPAVVAIAEAIGISEDEVVGKLHRLWSWADRHTTDGSAPGITARWVDKYLSSSGFASAMLATKWIEFNEHGVTFPNFDRHNGKSAKSRCEATTRQRLSRKNRDDGVTGSPRENIPRPFVAAVLKRDGYRCVYCGAQSDPKTEAHPKKSVLSIDHLIPNSRGGRTAVDNLVCCCKLCNTEKNDRTPEEWGLTPSFLQNDVAYVSHKICDARVTREEKRREEKNKKENPPLSPQGETVELVTVEQVTIPESMRTPSAIAALEEWLAYKRKRRQAYKDVGHVQRLVDGFATEHGENASCAFADAVNHSISHNWSGCFPDKTKARAQQRRKVPDGI